MKDEDLQKLIEGLFAGSVKIDDLADDEFALVLMGLSRVYLARVLNCVDASGKKDREWLMLSDVFTRANCMVSLHLNAKSKEDAREQNQ